MSTYGLHKERDPMQMNKIESPKNQAETDNPGSLIFQRKCQRGYICQLNSNFGHRTQAGSITQIIQSLIPK